MPAEVRQWLVKTPAGTDISAFQLTDLSMPDRIVRRISVRIPPGPRGELGFWIGAAGRQLIPWSPGQWIVGDDEELTFDLEGYITSGAWQVATYNLGQYNHGLQVRFELDPVTAISAAITPSAPLAVSTIAAVAGAAAGGVSPPETPPALVGPPVPSTILPGYVEPPGIFQLPGAFGAPPPMTVASPGPPVPPPPALPAGHIVRDPVHHNVVLVVDPAWGWSYQQAGLAAYYNGVNVIQVDGRWWNVLNAAQLAQGVSDPPGWPDTGGLPAPPWATLPGTLPLPPSGPPQRPPGAPGTLPPPAPHGVPSGVVQRPPGAPGTLPPPAPRFTPPVPPGVPAAGTGTIRYLGPPTRKL